MATLKQQAERLRRINLEGAVEIVLLTSDETLIAFNQKQLSEGRSNENTLIGRYTEFTERIANEEGSNIRPKKKGAPYNFEWSGEFFDAFKSKQIDGGVELTSGVSYLESIERLGSRNRAQNKLFGLHDDNLEKYIQKDLLPRVQKIIKETQ